jgi:PAS domain S-box-containing protein
MSSRTVAELTAIIDSVPNAAVMVDRAGKIELVNAEAERLFGNTRAELVGEILEMLVPHRFRAGLAKPKHTCAFEAVFAPPPHSQ